MDDLEAPTAGAADPGPRVRGPETSPAPFEAALSSASASGAGAVLVPTAPSSWLQAESAHEQADNGGLWSDYPDEEDPFGYGGGLDNLDPPTPTGGPVGHAHTLPSAAHVPSGADDPGGTRTPEVTAPPTNEAEAWTVPAPAVPLSHASPLVVPKPELDPAAPTAPPVDRRTALSAHLARRPAPNLSRREAALQRSMRDLQRQCTELGRTMAEAQARQGPLVQRLHAAQTRLGGLAAAPATAGSAAVQAMQAMLSQALHIQRNMPSL